MGLFKKKKEALYERPRDASIAQVFKESNLNTKISYVIFGFGNLVNKQIVRGAIFLAIEILYIVFMVMFGVGALGDFMTLGTVEQGQVYNEALGYYEYSQGDDSMLCLLYCVRCVYVRKERLLYPEAQGEGTGYSFFPGRHPVSEGGKPSRTADELPHFRHSLLYHCTFDFHDFDCVHQLRP